jgi:hypothetical protein
MQLALGPAGALVVALSFAVLAGRELRRKHQAEVLRLEALLTSRTAECAQTRDQLAAEHAARLEDAKATTTTLLALNDRIHKTLDSLEALTRGTRPPMS